MSVVESKWISRNETHVKDALNFLQPLYTLYVFDNYTYQISDALDILHGKLEKCKQNYESDYEIFEVIFILRIIPQIYLSHN